MITTFLLAWVLTASMSLLAWIHYLTFRINSIIDVFWPLGIASAGLFITHTDQSLAAIIVKGVVLVWSLRLASFLYITRVKCRKSDARYDNISSKWKRSKSYGYFWNFQLQAFLMVSLTAPFFWLNELQFSLSYWISIGLMIAAIIGETSADMHLYQHAQSKKEGLCLRGLWKYSRHPNYFCDWLFWLSFSIMCLHYPNGWITLSSPLILFWIMNYLTIPISENQSIKKRPILYKEYQTTTSSFFPFLKKKA